MLHSINSILFPTFATMYSLFWYEDGYVDALVNLTFSPEENTTDCVPLVAVKVVLPIKSDTTLIS